MRLFLFEYCHAVGNDLVDFVTGEIAMEGFNEFRIGWYTGKVLFHIRNLVVAVDTCESECSKQMRFGFFNRV